MKISTTLALSIIIVSIGIFIFSCNKMNQKAKTNDNLTPVSHKGFDTATTLANFQTDTVIWVKDGQYIMVTHEDSHDEENESFKTDACTDGFAGSARSAAKTSFVSASYGTYSTINALRATLPTDTYMKGLGITNTSGRVSDENKNRTITTSYLYAISRESDNDFHMIIGDATSSAGNLFNCEASGNPASSASSYSAINAVRSYIKSYFGTDFCSQSGYTKFSPAIKVTTLKGSIFFDIDHAAGTVGPTGLRPNTAWEMHPIHNLAF